MRPRSWLQMRAQSIATRGSVEHSTSTTAKRREQCRSNIWILRGRLVQSPSVAGADRKCAAGGIGTGVLSPARRVGSGSLTQLQLSPKNRGASFTARNATLRLGQTSEASGEDHRGPLLRQRNTALDAAVWMYRIASSFSIKPSLKRALVASATALVNPM